jgi:hypothetical protein
MKNLLFFLLGLAATLIVGFAAVRPVRVAGPDKHPAAVPSVGYATITRNETGSGRFD